MKTQLKTGFGMTSAALAACLLLPTTYANAAETYATFYRDINQGGFLFRETSAYDGIPNANLTLNHTNDMISCIVVAKGHSITIYENINYGGHYKTLGPGTHNLTNYIMSGKTSWNDQMSSYTYR
jgi:hypothetical protein